MCFSKTHDFGFPSFPKTHDFGSPGLDAVRLSTTQFNDFNSMTPPMFHGRTCIPTLGLPLYVCGMGFGFRGSECGFRFPVSGFRLSVFGFQFSVFGFWFSRFGFQVSECGVSGVYVVRSDCPQKRRHKPSCPGGSYLRFIDFYHSTLGLRVTKKKKKVPAKSPPIQ